MDADALDQRRILTQIAAVSWEHPSDRAALNALRKIPGFDRALRKIFSLFGERAIRLAYKANAIRTSENQYSNIHARLRRVCEVLDVAEPPECYVSQVEKVNAGAIGFKEPFIVLSSSMLEILTDDEVEAVLGHEVGHILSGHVFYRTLMDLLSKIIMFGYPLTGIALVPIYMGLLEWYRKSEVSSDRAALLAMQNPEIVMSALMKLAGGIRGGELNLDEFILQSEEYKTGGSVLDSVYRVLNVLGQTHPFAVMRVAEVRQWIESGDYDRVLGGDYQRRDEQDDRPYREDLKEAMDGYREGARDFMDEMDKTVDRFRSRFGEMFKARQDN